MTVYAQNPGYRVAFEHSTATSSSEVNVSWHTPSDRASRLDWIGIYKKGASDRYYVAWQYLPNGQTEGMIAFSNLSPGEYEVRMFTNNEYVRVASGPSTLRVRATDEENDSGTGDGDTEPPAGVGSYHVTLDQSTYTQGETIRVVWSAPPNRDSSRDWVGIYRTGAGDREYLTWQYLPSGPEETGELFFTVHQAGTYEARIFLKNGYTRASDTRASFTVRATSGEVPDDDTDDDGTDDPTEGNASSSGSYTVSFYESSSMPNDAIRVRWTAPSHRTTEHDWVGLYRANTSDRQYVSWQYIPASGASGDLTFRINQTGTYEARVFTANGYTRVARSEDRIVVRTDTEVPPNDDTDGDTSSGTYILEPTALIVSAGSSITLNWQAPEGAQVSRDWIGVYRPGASDRSYLTYQYVSTHAQHGAVTFTARTPGTYEFRYFKHDGYTRVATSALVTVETEPVPACAAGDLSGIENYPPREGPIIAFGDSLTQGVGATRGQDVVSQLERKAGVSIVNAGVSGDTTQDALDRLQRDVLSRDPSVVIVWLGGNDILQRYYEDVFRGAENPNLIEAIRIVLLRITGKLPEPSGISEDETFENLTDIIERIQAQGAITIVVGFSGGVFDSKLEGRYEDVAQETNSLYVPNALNGVIGRPALMSDLVHPNNIGYGIVADRILPLLSCVL